jgi:hypothetical protein
VRPPWFYNLRWWRKPDAVARKCRSRYCEDQSGCSPADSLKHGRAGNFRLSLEFRQRIGASLDIFEFEVIEEGDILRLILKGPATLRELLRAVATVVAEIKSRRIWQVLCDATSITSLGAFERFEVGVELARVADKRMKLAVVARADLIDYIFENVARNRGASVRVFADTAAALRWLRESTID